MQNPLMYKVGDEIGIDNKLSEDIADYLNQKGLLIINSKDNDVSITTLGIDNVESIFSDSNSYIDSNEIQRILIEINNKLDLLNLGQEIIYEDISEKVDANNKINEKDLKTTLLSIALTKGFDALKIGQIVDLLNN